MNPDILTMLLIFLVLLLIGSVAMSAYLLYDIKSGNYRKFMSAEDDHESLAETVRNFRKENLGE